MPRSFKGGYALAALALLAIPGTSMADPVPGVSVAQAYDLIRDTMLAFSSPPEAMLARFASVPGGSWDTVPLVIDMPADPQAMRLRHATEVDANGTARLTSRQLDCTRLGPAGLQAVNAGEVVAPSVVFGASQKGEFDSAMETMALQSLAYAASTLAAYAGGAVMQCSMTIALAPSPDPKAELTALMAADFAGITEHPEGAVDFFDGLPTDRGTLAVLRVSVPEADGQRFLYISAVSAELPHGS